MLPLHALIQKGDVMILEVGSLGFRCLRPTTEAPLLLFPWGQIHSWAHGPDKFTFRYFDDGWVAGACMQRKDISIMSPSLLHIMMCWSMHACAGSARSCSMWFI